MARSKKSSAATRALNSAIAEATAELRETVKRKDQEIAGLHSVIRQIVGIASAVSFVEARAIPAPMHHAPPPEVELPQGPRVDLSEEDNLGEGRWAP